jgi:hypothetical protein
MGLSQNAVRPQGLRRDDRLCPPEDRREGPKITLPILRFGNLVGSACSTGPDRRQMSFTNV